MIDLRITGPGSIINNQLAVIRKALEDTGHKVTVYNEHPAVQSDNQLINFITNRNTESQHEVVIVMDHQPWGG